MQQGLSLWRFPFSMSNGMRCGDGSYRWVFCVAVLWHFAVTVIFNWTYILKWKQWDHHQQDVIDHGAVWNTWPWVFADYVDGRLTPKSIRASDWLIVCTAVHAWREKSHVTTVMLKAKRSGCGAEDVALRNCNHERIWDFTPELRDLGSVHSSRAMNSGEWALVGEWQGICQVNTRKWLLRDHGSVDLKHKQYCSVNRWLYLRQK